MTRCAAALLAVGLAACTPEPPRVPPTETAARPDPTTEAWYADTVGQLTAMSRDAEAAFRKGHADEAAAAVTKCRPLMDRLLSAPQPTLAAMEAVSDVDQLYGRMLMSNGHYVWARDTFQKNVTRWTAWKPPSPDTARRLDLARQALAECDRRMKEKG